jgi:hypothetical protein
MPSLEEESAVLYVARHAMLMLKVVTRPRLFIILFGPTAQRVGVSFTNIIFTLFLVYIDI